MSIKMKIYSDYMCPFCYLALAYVDELKKTMDLDVEWINYELHPDTPDQGILLADRFGEEKTKGLIEALNRMGNQFGLKFGDLYFMPNSRLVLEASEYAKESGCFDDFHHKVFYEHFTNLSDIGDADVVKSIASECGMDKKELMKKIEGHCYTERIKSIRKTGEALGACQTPYFIIEDEYFLERPCSIDDIINILKKTGRE